MRCLLFKKTYRSLLIAICVSLAIGVVIGFHLSQIHSSSTNLQSLPAMRQSVESNPPSNSHVEKNLWESTPREGNIRNEASQKDIHVDLKHRPSKKTEWPKINYNVHTFYYMWYGNPTLNGHYIHWNHARLPHWDSSIAKQHSREKHRPPDDIGANYYPQLGLYSSSDSAIVYKHMEMIRSAGIGVVVVSWYHKDRNDPNGSPIDHLIPMLLDTAHLLTLKVAIHMEPYEGRTVRTIHEELEYIFNSNYTRHPAYYKRKRSQGRQPLPVFYIYDSYIIDVSKWRQLTQPEKHLNIRDTKLDSFLVGLYLNSDSCQILADSGFDAGYTYFASQKVSYGSNPSNWQQINSNCAAKNVLFAPSIGPGYVDTAVRPWNNANTQRRLRGAQYRRMFWSMMRLSPRPAMWSVTSFNEWHEGSQIEPAVPKENYFDYRPNRPNFYLEMSRRFVKVYSELPANAKVPKDENDNIFQPEE